eukprot:767091-Hanusia_phi.AAC.2
MNPAKLNITNLDSLATFRNDLQGQDGAMRKQERGEEDELFLAAKQKMSTNRDIICCVKNSLKVASYPKLQELICSMEEDEWQKKQRARRRLQLVASRKSAERHKAAAAESFGRVQLELRRRGLLDGQGRWKEEEKLVMVPCGVRRMQVEHRVANRGMEDEWMVVSFEEQHTDICLFDEQDERMCRAREEKRLVVESRSRVRVLAAAMQKTSVFLVLLRSCEEMELSRRVAVTNYKSSSEGLYRSEEACLHIHFVRPMPTSHFRIFVNNFCSRWEQGEKQESLHEMIVPGTRGPLFYRICLSLEGRKSDGENNSLLVACEYVRWINGSWQTCERIESHYCRTVRTKKKRSEMLKDFDLQFLTCILDPLDETKTREQWIFDICSFLQQDVDMVFKDVLQLELDKKACAWNQTPASKPVVHVSTMVMNVNLVRRI